MCILTYEDCTQDLENRGQNASLAEVEDSRADRGAEGVSHIIGPHPEGKDEGHNETGDDKRKEFVRPRLHGERGSKGRSEGKSEGLEGLVRGREEDVSRGVSGLGDVKQRDLVRRKFGQFGDGDRRVCLVVC